MQDIWTSKDLKPLKSETEKGVCSDTAKQA